MATKSYTEFRQDCLRFSLCFEVEYYISEHKEATGEGFLRAFLEGEKESPCYGEDIKDIIKCLKTEVLPLYSTPGSPSLSLA